MKRAFSLPVMAVGTLFLAALNVQAQPIASVQIVGPLPLPVQKTIPAEPYQRTINTAVWTNSTSGATSFVNFSDIWSIPAGKVLVVEHVSVRVRVNPGEKISASLTCQGTSAGLSSHRLPVTSQGIFDGHEHLLGTTPLRCYTNNLLIVSFTRNSTDPLTLVANTEFSVSGFLADEP